MTESQQHSPDVVVIGGGVIGLSVAWEACRHGLRPLVVERHRVGAGTSGVAAGMLAPVSEAAFGEPELLALNLESARRYPTWVTELAEASGGVDPGWRACGSLLVARDRDQAEALERERAFRVDQGLEVNRLTPSAARRRERGLAPTLRLALEVPDDHAIDPGALLAALSAAVVRGGGCVREGAEVAGLLTAGRRVAGVRLEGGAEVKTGQVVIAAGCWSGAIAGLPAGDRLPLRPVKGQLLRLRDPAGPGLLRHVVRSEEAYLVPRGDGRYVVGATLEERGWDTSVTAGAVWELLREAIELVPGLAELELEAAVAGLRPGTPDNAPVIGPGELEGVLWATGHYRHGVLLAPVTAQAVAAHLGGQPVPEAAAPFGPRRFAQAVAA